MIPARPVKIGVTGGIGSGKSTVCRMFAMLGVPVYDSDERAKWLMAHDGVLIERIKEAFGPEAYAGGEPDRAFLASRVFGDKAALAKLNSLVHPAVMCDFDDWTARQSGSPYVILESAIIFEAGLKDRLDSVVVVSAPAELRLKRVEVRDNTCRTKVEARMANQMGDEERELLADYVIRNDERELVWEQVLALDATLRSAV